MPSHDRTISVIIPARNEEALIGSVLDSVLVASERLSGRKVERFADAGVEVLVVDDESEDTTAELVRSYDARHGVTLIAGKRGNSARARNRAVPHSHGEILCFLDADTLLRDDSLSWVREAVARGKTAGICALVSLEPGLRARCWWAFWNQVRRLPIARAKAMPAFMFCTRAVFERYGPFDERVAISEEWPILARLYHDEPSCFLYDRSHAVRSSSRRMELRRFGYLRTFAKYVAVVLFPSGRVHHSDHIRHRMGIAP